MVPWMGVGLHGPCRALKRLSFADRAGQKLSSAQKYGHPFDRPIYASAVPPELMVDVVLSFMRHGLEGLEPRAGGWSWDELQELNRRIAWGAWELSITS